MNQLDKFYKSLNYSRMQRSSLQAFDLFIIYDPFKRKVLTANVFLMNNRKCLIKFMFPRNFLIPKRERSFLFITFLVSC